MIKAKTFADGKVGLIIKPDTQPDPALPKKKRIAFIIARSMDELRDARHHYTHKDEQLQTKIDRLEERLADLQNNPVDDDEVS